jgi:hydrogenase maturation protein HypF
MNLTGTEIRIRGKVQGVGFRPFVWQLARQLGLRGSVCNDGAGVAIRLVENAAPLLARLKSDCPPLARIDSVESRPYRWRQIPGDFRYPRRAPAAPWRPISPRMPPPVPTACAK